MNVTKIYFILDIIQLICTVWIILLLLKEVRDSYDRGFNDGIDSVNQNSNL